jgi:hypothetical protein
MYLQMKLSPLLPGTVLVLFGLIGSSLSASKVNTVSADRNLSTVVDTVPRPTPSSGREVVPSTRERVSGTTLSSIRVAGRREVTAHSPTIAAVPTMMNVIYVGVDNPIELVGVVGDEENISVKVNRGNLRKITSSKYVMTASEVGTTRMTIRREGRPPVESTFRIKRVPDPVALVSGKLGGTMGSGEFKAQGGVVAQLRDFDFDARCQVVSFELTYLAPRRDPITVLNDGARYNSQARRLVNSAKPGDIYYYTNVKAACPGDPDSRSINSLVFRIR